MDAWELEDGVRALLYEIEGMDGLIDFHQSDADARYDLDQHLLARRTAALREEEETLAALARRGAMTRSASCWAREAAELECQVLAAGREGEALRAEAAPWLEPLDCALGIVPKVGFGGQRSRIIINK